MKGCNVTTVLGGGEWGYNTFIFKICLLLVAQIYTQRNQNISSTKAIFPPFHLIWIITRQIFSLQWNPALSPLDKYAHHVITATLFWPEKMLSQWFSYLMTPSNATTPLTWAHFCGPFVTRLTVKWRGVLPTWNNHRNTLKQKPNSDHNVIFNYKKWIHRIFN